MLIVFKGFKFIKQLHRSLMTCYVMVPEAESAITSKKRRKKKSSTEGLPNLWENIFRSFIQIISSRETGLNLNGFLCDMVFFLCFVFF